MRLKPPPPPKKKKKSGYDSTSKLEKIPYSGCEYRLAGYKRYNRCIYNIIFWGTN